ncbi:MAG TPA: hypothetical protein VGI13_14500 [Candidatus Acidoferrum sp.]
MELDTIGIDLGKTVFHVVGPKGAPKLGCASDFLATTVVALDVELAGPVKRHGSLRRPHFLGRALREQGHEISAYPGAVHEAIREDEQE